MRIIAGTHRGRKMITPEGDEIRPTSDRVRESLFSILGNISEVTVIDGFAGTGALGLEALSRGAKKVSFFDTSKEAISLIRENLKQFDLANTSSVFHGSFGKNISLVNTPANLIFLDPPYKKEMLRPALDALLGSNALAEDALIIMEHSRYETVDFPERFEKEDERTYGKTTLTFLRLLLE